MRVTRHRYAVDGWGVGEIWVADGVLVAHDMPDADLSPADGGDEPADTPYGGAGAPSGTVAAANARGTDGFVADLCRRFHKHLDGVRTDYGDVALDLSWCTPFQAELAAALQRIPWGEVVSYGELATLAGRPRAARAAGTFCAQNQFALVLPCHRVVAADGIGGYGAAGVGRKRRLLALENVVL